MIYLGPPHSFGSGGPPLTRERTGFSFSGSFEDLAGPVGEIVDHAKGEARQKDMMVTKTPYSVLPHYLPAMPPLLERLSTQSLEASRV